MHLNVRVDLAASGNELYTVETDDRGRKEHGLHSRREPGRLEAFTAAPNDSLKDERETVNFQNIKIHLFICTGRSPRRTSQLSLFSQVSELLIDRGGYL